MCGIVGFIGKQKVSDRLFEGLLNLEYRGYDSVGIAVLSEGRIKYKKSSGRVAELMKITESEGGISGKVGIGHTRWATHGAATTDNAHPHISYDNRFALVHNGIIENYLELKADLINKGIHFKSDTDTEVIVQLIAKNYFGDPIAAIDHTLKKLEGSFAIALICTDFPNTIFAAKKGSPLIVGVSREEKMLASDISAISSFAEKICRIEDQEILKITPTEFTVYTNGQTVSKKFEEVKLNMTKTDKGEFEHFMLKEIFEQPEVAKNIIKKRIKNGKVSFEELSPEILYDIRRINIVACGSAYNAGMVAKYILEELLSLPVLVSMAGEFRYGTPISPTHSLSVFISQSGETADTISAAELIKSKKGASLSIVNVEESSLTKITDHTLYTEAGPEIAVATTKGYTSQVLLLCLFGIWASEHLNIKSEKQLSEYIDAIESIPEIMLRCLGAKETASKLAKGFKNTSSLYFMGRNIDYGVALEASLKLKEISYIHSEAYSAGELKHGSIALIEKGVTVITLGCHKPLIGKTISNIKEVKARGAFVIASCREDDASTPMVADKVIPLPIIHPITEAVCEIIPFQLFAYFVATEKGLDVDKPRNLAKSVTVE